MSDLNSKKFSFKNQYHEIDPEEPSDDTSQLLGSDSDRLESCRLSFMETSKKQMVLIFAILLMVCVASFNLIGIVAFSYPSSTTVSSAFTENISMSKSTSQIPFSTVTSERSTRLPDCHYRDWSSMTCPDGEGWACWADESRRNGSCKKRVWMYGWGTMIRPWPVPDCFCCSSIPCTYD